MKKMPMRTLDNLIINEKLKRPGGEYLKDLKALKERMIKEHDDLPAEKKLVRPRR